jgi:MoxR-like ATPase
MGHDAVQLRSASKEKHMTAETAERLEDAIIKAAETTAAQARTARANISAVIFGQDKDVIDHALLTVLCGGHALLVGVPGLAKTKLVETMGTVLGLDARRVSSSRPT